MSIKLNVWDGLGAVRWKNANSTPWDFGLFGTKVFCGSQGSGKTLSAVRWVHKLCCLFPSLQVCTNLELYNFPPWTVIHDYDGLDSLFTLSNGVLGIVYLIDELQLELSSLESRSIPISVITEISQQRKQRKMIVGTAQVLQRLAKPVREQFDQIVDCSNYLGVLQANRIYDCDKIRQNEAGEIELEDGRLDVFFHAVADYQRYDTSAKMKKYTKDFLAISQKYDKALYNGDNETE